MNKRMDNLGGCFCGMYLVIFSAFCWLATFLFDFCLEKCFGLDIAWYWDFLAGILTAEFTLPIAIIIAILEVGGVHTPFWPQ